MIFVIDLILPRKRLGERLRVHDDVKISGRFPCSLLGGFRGTYLRGHRFVPHLHSAIILNTELPPNLDWTSKSLGNHAQIGREGFLPERDY